MPEAGDPMDRAYTRAEALLADSNERAARRARVIAAVGRQPAKPAAANLSSDRQPELRHGGWLAAASIAGLGVFLATRVYQPPPQPARTMPTPPAISAPAAPPQDRKISPPSGAKTSMRAEPSPAPRTLVPPPLAVTPPPMDIQPAAAPPPPPPPVLAAPRAFPSEPSPSSVEEAVVTAERRASLKVAGNQAPTGAFRDENLGALSSARMAAKPAPPPPPPPPPPLALEAKPTAGSLATQTERLGVASTAGRLSEIESLLAQGVPVDAPDADGETPLMKSIQADKPAAVSLLLQHGARLDQRNHAGVSARQMAEAAADPALERAAGVTP